MKIKDFEKISKQLREERVTHLLFARFRKGVSLSSIITGDDLYDFLQILADQNPVTLEIMQDVIDSRKKNVKPKSLIYN